jgi:hypothetical protein
MATAFGAVSRDATMSPAGLLRLPRLAYVGAMGSRRTHLERLERPVPPIVPWSRRHADQKLSR